MKGKEQPIGSPMRKRGEVKKERKEVFMDGELGGFLRKVAEGKENALEIVKEVLEDGKEKVTIALQNRVLQPEPPLKPERADSPKRAHEFHDVDGLISYLERYKTENTVVFGDANSGRISVVLDEEASLGFEVLYLSPALHPLFKPWASLIAKGALDITEFAEFLLQNRRVIVEPNARELVLNFSQVRASIRTTVRKGRGTKAINGVMVESEIQGEGSSEPIDLPETITIETPLYVNTVPREMELDLLVASEGEKVVVLLGSAMVEEAKYKAFEEMLASVSNVEDVTTAFGNPGHAAWDIVKKQNP